MGFFSKLFSGPKPITKVINGLGEFEFYNDGTDRYWKIERPISNLPEEFEFGVIAGDVHTIEQGALDFFKKAAENPAILFSLLNDEFISKASENVSNVDKSNIQEEFYLRSLTTSDIDSYEFGLHSRSKDIFIELFVRKGEVSEIYVDEGCCEV